MSHAIFRFDSRKEDRLLGLPNVCQSIRRLDSAPHVGVKYKKLDSTKLMTSNNIFFSNFRNTIMRDLQSKNEAENSMALITASYIVPNEMSPMILPIVSEKVNSSRDFVRKKALICLEQIAIKSPESVNKVLDIVTLSLADKDPSVV